MLEELSVRNYALIESLNLTFGSGLTILTGETGAGKSIIVGSLSFLLGAKTDESVVRTGTDEASVAAVLSIGSQNNDALNWLASREIEIEDGRVIARRIIKTNGRSSAYIQNIPVQRTDLADFMALLFDIHGQHAHESLGRRENHRKYLDRFAELEDEAIAFNKIFLELAEKRGVLEKSDVSIKERDTRIEILTFSVDEIEKSALKNGESAALEAEAARLASFEKLSGLVETGVSAFCKDDNSALNLCRKAKNAFENASSFDAKLNAVAQRISSLFYEAEDISSEIHSYMGELSFDPVRLEAVEERLSHIYKLKKKYLDKMTDKSPDQNDEDALLAYKAQAEAEIEALKSSDQDRESLKNEISTLEKDIRSRAAALSAKRKAASDKLSQRITSILKDLGMPNAVFSVSLAQKAPIEGGQGGLVLGPWGADDVEFLITANTGESAKELRRIASGGELSRVMLAIKTALTGEQGAAGNNEDSVETLIFDEIDTGIGGEVALAVGEYLWKIGGKKQIFCITHLASIACRADNHIKVEKFSDGKRTHTTVSCLKPQDRRQEIARMLSGSKGETALAHAGELLVKYGRVRNG